MRSSSTVLLLLLYNSPDVSNDSLSYLFHLHVGFCRFNHCGGVLSGNCCAENKSLLVNIPTTALVDVTSFVLYCFVAPRYNSAMLRALNILVEASDDKSPAQVR